MYYVATTCVRACFTVAVAVWSSVCNVCDTCVAIKGACVFMLLSLLDPAFHRVGTKCY